MFGNLFNCQNKTKLTSMPRNSWPDCAKQGSFPAGTPGNGGPKVILTVGTAFPLNQANQL